MPKKYEITDEKTLLSERTVVYRIRALIDFGNIKAGEMGGFIERENNLSQNGTAWVGGNAVVFDNAFITNNAHVFGDALVCDNAIIAGNAKIFGNARISGEAFLVGNTKVSGDSSVQ